MNINFPVPTMSPAPLHLYNELEIVRFRCHGCGTMVDPAITLPFRCPQTRKKVDDIDHVLSIVGPNILFTAEDEPNPFVRYRKLLSVYQLSRVIGLSDTAWIEIAENLNESVKKLCDRTLSVTPMVEASNLAAALSFKDIIWVKNETVGVGGSHKARHLALVILYLKVLEITNSALWETIYPPRLAIASCGNAAIAACLLARAVDWPLDVFVPDKIEPPIFKILKEFGANVILCPLTPDDPSDPCVRRLRAAVHRGSIPFTVQGSENGLAIEGAVTLAFEMAEVFQRNNLWPRTIFIQSGGGALTSALAQGFLRVSGSVSFQMPRIVAVQADSCAPLVRAWKRLGNASVYHAALNRSAFMWPWKAASASVAGGLLDVESYDWCVILDFMQRFHGFPISVTENLLVEAHQMATNFTDISPSATGAAGLAGAMLVPEHGPTAIIFSGAG